MRESLGIIEVHGFCPSLAVLDAMDKMTVIRLLHIELNDLYGTCIRIAGDTANVELALDVGREKARTMGSAFVSSALKAPNDEAFKVIEAKREFSELLEAELVFFPDSKRPAPSRFFAAGRETSVSESQDYAIGLIETQGFTAVFEAVDTACKAANVEVIGREKLGGGYITVIIKGDVAAVEAAVEAGKARVEGLGKLIAAHVIARPSRSVLSLLPAS